MAEIINRDQDRRQQLNTDILAEIAGIASSTLELRVVLDTIAHRVADRLDKDLCSICLLKPDNKVVCIEAARGGAAEDINVFCINDEEGSICGLFGEGRPLVIKDIETDEMVRNVLHPIVRTMRSLLAVPIIIHNKMAGILITQSADPHEYSLNELNLMTIISHNLSIAVQNAELYRNVKSQLDELKVIHEISKAITSILNLDELLPYICREVSRVFHVTGCVLRLVEGEMLHIKASHGLPDRIVERMTLRLGEGIAGHVALTGKPMRVDDLKKMPENLRLPGVEAKSVICAPLVIGEHIIGTLGLYDKEDEWGIISFAENDLNSLITFAAASAIAIENARLYTAEIEKEKEVTQTKDYLKSLIDNSADAIVTSDREGQIISWNKGAEIIYGYTESEVLGRFLPMVPTFLVEEEKKYREKINAKETLRNMETIRQLKSGRLIEVSLTLSPILDSGGNVTGISGISRDISEKKIVEKELLRKNQELSRLFFINSVVRSTLDLDKLLKMVLTVITMGDGLGFNRAILFLADEQGTELRGTMGVGPASPEEANDILLSMEGKSLGAMIEEIERGPFNLDSHLDRLSQRLQVSLQEDSIMRRCISEKRPFNIQDARNEPSVTPYLIQMLGAEAFAIVPLIVRDRVIGVIWVDNLFTGKPIKYEDLHFLSGFSSHIASAIENARLFESVSLARAELKNIFESVTDMIFFTDEHCVIRRVNNAVIDRTGKTEEELVGKKCYAVFHGGNEPRDDCPHYESMRKKKPFIGEIDDAYLGGTFVISNSPIFDSSGNFVGTVHISRDITELRTLRERVAHSERMAALGELAARVAHEIRNPLISIGGFARRLEKKLTDDSREYAKIIVTEVSRLENILKEILGFVKTSRVMKRRVDVNEMLTSIIVFMTPEVNDRNNVIINKLSDTPIMSMIDPDRIREALLNMVSNASQATENGCLTIKTYVEVQEVVIELRDNGCGIRSEDINNIFNPFFTTKSEGTGLGLAVTHKIIEEHDGKIKVESVPGEGTIFRIYLPLDK